MKITSSQQTNHLEPLYQVQHDYFWVDIVNGDNFTHIKRSKNSTFTETLKKVLTKPFSETEILTGNESALDSLLRPVQEFPWVKQILKKDIHSVFQTFCQHANRSMAKARLELVESDACKKWHVDNVRIRGLVTYFGPGTLFADSIGVDRYWLGNTSDTIEVINKRIVFNPDAVHAALAGDLLIAYGGEKGLVHRSPSIECCNEKRLVLKLDEV